MTRSKIVADLQQRLFTLLSEPEFAQERNERARTSKGPIADALFAHNSSLAEELTAANPDWITGEVADDTVRAFRDHLTHYLDRNGTGHEGYDRYIAILTEYLALVALRPLHPLEIRRMENEPPEDSGNRKYCGLRNVHLTDDRSLCRFCNCLPWPRPERKAPK